MSRFLTKNRQRKLLGLLLALLTTTLGWLGQQQGWFTQTGASLVNNQPGLYFVEEVVDGDTITVNMNGKFEDIRMIGIDTPETRDPRKPVQCFGAAATDFTKSLIKGSHVRLEADPDNTNRDRYGRLLRYVYSQDGRLVNAEIIKAGYGFAYTSFPFGKAQQFKELEALAMEQKLGLWKDCVPIKNNYGGYSAQ